MSREFELRKEVVLPATPEQVWEAITTPQGLASWFMPMEVGAEGAVDWNPPKRFATKTPVAEDGSFHAFEYLIEGRDGSTVLRFVHSGMYEESWGEEYEDMTSSGWDMYLHTLLEYFTHFAGRPVVYVTVEGPESSAQAESWSKLAAALGVRAVGDAVRVEVEGIPVVEGVVDYLLPSFVGVRGSDALYRFHGRAALGMVVAVGHHVYRDDVDGEVQSQAWEAWLRGVFA